MKDPTKKANQATSSDSGIIFRMSKEENSRLREEAANSCMSINQYIKYKVFDTPLNKNFPLLMHLAISGYMHIRALGLKHLTKQEIERIDKESEEEFQKLGIQKDGSID